MLKKLLNSQIFCISPIINLSTYFLGFHDRPYPSAVCPVSLSYGDTMSFYGVLGC